MENPVEHVIVKTEMQSNGEILLFYVDENGDNEEGVLTTVQNIESEAIELQQAGHTSTDIIDDTRIVDDWTDDQTNRLLIFYIDNKIPFLSGTTKRDHLWTVACKTMLIGKTPTSCEAKLNALRNKYIEGYLYQKSGLVTIVPFQELCHQAFHDENNTNFQIEIIEPTISDVQLTQNLAVKNNEEIVPIPDTIIKTKTADEKVKLLLNLYLKNKKAFQKEYPRRDLWDAIAKEIGEDDGIYWQKRFLNYKQHYIRLLASRDNGPVKWPYIDYFDKIFEDDAEFKRKCSFLQSPPQNATETPKRNQNYWNDTEITVLAKYCYDCFDEFLDETIPKNFLWNEIGRLLDRPPDLCRMKYNQLKNQHYDKYIEGCYEIRERKPLEIIFDNIINREVNIRLNSDKDIPVDIWKTDNIDELVQFMYQNTEMFKDKICHFVCWASVAKKLHKDVRNCKNKWEELVTLYRTILEDKKEDPSMQIDWRYIDLFDRIFDYGMDINLLNGYDHIYRQKDDAANVKKVTMKSNKELAQNGTDDENEIYDDDDNKNSGDSKAFKILEYYQKNKDKFTSPHRNKHVLWEVLAKQIGISATQCAHRLRNLKQVYITYVQREINKPEMPILWPYYILCKKVFGYRAIKAKLKNSKHNADVVDGWSAKEIKMLLNYLSRHFNKIDRNVEDSSAWSELAKELTKTEYACKEKFLELRKSYRKLKTKITRHPNWKISWKYFSILDNIYSQNVTNVTENGVETSKGNMEFEQLEEWMDDKSQQDDDDYQCIIVLPEGQEMTNMDTSEIILENETLSDIQINVDTKTTLKWTKQLKKRLLILYMKYIKINKGKKINAKEMWNQIGLELDKKPITCRKMFVKLKANYHKNKNDAKKMPYEKLIEKILKLKPKFEKIEKNTNNETKDYKDVEMEYGNVVKALQYYLQHVDEFSSPKFDKKCLWQELAGFISEPVSKVYNKINFLKQAYNTNNTCGIEEFDEIIREIITKDVVSSVDDTKNEIDMIEDTPWNNDEVKSLLEWYLSNLEKFKNPKFVRKYLWMEVSQLLKKTPLSCSKKMTEIRMQYKTMIKENPENLDIWEFYDLCQKIYGTGKKMTV